MSDSLLNICPGKLVMDIPEAPEADLQTVPPPATYYEARNYPHSVFEEPPGIQVVPREMSPADQQGVSVGHVVGQPSGTVVQYQAGAPIMRCHPPPRQIPICAFCGGMLRDQYTTLGILLAIFCFPFGLICCIKFREMRCTICGR